MERRDVIVVGGGPAGSATALYLARRDPALARRVLILEKAEHPRDKVCAGGLIPHTLDCLAELGVGLAGIPHVTVERGRCELPGGRVEVAGDTFCAVVRRRELDAALLAAARAVGAEVREREKVRAITRVADGVTVATERDDYHARLVVGADGSGSLVRRTLLAEGRDPATIGRAVMADVPLDGRVAWDGHAVGRYDFDFRDVPGGLDGYVWLFPCLIDGRPHANVGVYGMRARGGVDLVSRLRALQQALGAPDVRHQAAPIRCWAPAPFVGPRVLLVGDAAGVEPLMGEGISFAFEYGRWAAEEIAAAFAAGAFELRGAERRFRRSAAGRKLQRLRQVARLAYGPAGPLCLGVAARWRGAQEIGLRWYNGVDGADRQNGWRLLWSALRAAPVATAPPLVQ